MLETKQQVPRGCSVDRGGEDGQLGEKSGMDMKELTLKVVQGKGVMDGKPPVLILERP